MMSISSDFAVKKMSIIDNHTSLQITYQIWDMNLGALPNRIEHLKTCGSCKVNFLGCSGGLVVFDLTNKDSFNTIPQWIETFFAFNKRGVVPIAIIGNKLDLEDLDAKTIPTEEYTKLSQNLKEQYPTLNIQWYRVSTTDTSGITDIFVNFAREMLEARTYQT